MRRGFLVIHLLFLLVFFHLPLWAGQYQFIGKMRNYRAEKSGIVVNCDPGVRVRIRFYQPDLFRVTFFNRQTDEALLKNALVNRKWTPVPFQIEEKAENIILHTAALDVVIRRTPFRMAVRDQQGRLINEDDPGMGIGWEGREVRVWKTISPDEKFFGLGEKTGNINKRGRQWVMWNSDNPGYNNGTDPLYQSIPFFIGLRFHQAYGIFLNNSYRSVFNFEAGNRRYYSFGAAGGNLDYFFIYGPKISEVVESYTLLTGRTPLPPIWALGYQQSRWSYYPQSAVLRLAKTFRERKIPADVLYLDIDYMNGYRVFTWDKNRFPSPQKMMQKLSTMGFKTVVIIDPGVKADSTYAVARQGTERNYFLKYPDGETYTGNVWAGPSFFPDFSRLSVRRWWGGWLGSLLKMGVRGFWDDMNEPSVWGKVFPPEVIFFDGGRKSNAKKMHNLYGLMMAQAAYASFARHKPGRRPFVLTRAGFAGEQRYTAAWTGDNTASFEHLALGIRILQGMGLSGVPFVGTDTGGFIGSPSPELFARWIEASVFAPLFRNHTAKGTRPQEPWAFGEEIEAISRKYIELRYRFLPYLYSLFWEAQETGSPLIRPLFWNDQDDETAFKPDFQEQFLVGDNLMVAPVTKSGQRYKRIYLPSGKWIDFNSRKEYEGPIEIVVETPLSLLPMFLRAGAIIPERDLQQFADQRPVKELILNIYPQSTYGNFMLYEDDGQTTAYLQNVYRLTQIEFLRGKNSLQISRNLLHQEYRIPKRQVNIRLWAVRKTPKAVKLNGLLIPKISDGKAVAGYRFDEKKKLLQLFFAETDQKQTIKIEW